MRSLLSGTHIRARFRSWDLWVMGPPRFRCATLICCEHSALKEYSLIKNAMFANQMIRPLVLSVSETRKSETIKAMASTVPFTLQPKFSHKPVPPSSSSSSSRSSRSLTLFAKLNCPFVGSTRSLGWCRSTRKLGPNCRSRVTCWFKFGKNGVDAEGAGIYGSQSRDDFDRDDVEQYFNYMGMLAVEGSYDKMEALLNQNIHPVDILLLMAASEGDKPKIEELLRAGADYTVKDVEGRTALDRAADEIKDFILNFSVQKA